MNFKISVPSVIAFFQRNKLPAIFCAALMFGLFAAYGIKSHLAEFMASERDKLTPKVKTVDVVVARRNFQAGEMVGPESMAVRSIPEAYVASNAVRPERFEGYIGSKLGQRLQGGETLLSTAMTGADVSSFSSKVRPGIRALTISVDDVNSVSGMLQPGDRIDLMVSLKPPAQNMPSGVAINLAEMTSPLLQDILVLATGRNVRPGAVDEQTQRGFNAITVEVTPENAQVLIVAQRSGKLTALLRNPSDRNELPKRPLDIYALLGMRPVSGTVQAPAKASPAIPVVEPQTSSATEIIVGGRGALTRSGSSHAQASAERGAVDKVDDTLPVDPARLQIKPTNVRSPDRSSGAPDMKDAPPRDYPRSPGIWPAQSLPQSSLELR